MAKSRTYEKVIKKKNISTKLKSLIAYSFFYKQSIFDPRPENCLSCSKKSPLKNCLAIV